MSNKIKINKAYSVLEKLDSDIKIYDDKIKKLRQDRKKYETYIIEKIKDKNDFITGSNVKLKIQSKVKSEPLSQKLIRKGIVNHYSNKFNRERCNRESNEILESILNSRNKTLHNILKAYK